MKNESVVSILRSCRETALKDCDKYGAGDNYALISKARASAYLFALSLLVPDGPEAREWDENQRELLRTESKEDVQRCHTT